MTPWDHLRRAHRHAWGQLERWSGTTLTLLLLALGLVIVWIALRGSNRLKAASAVWVIMP